MYFTPPRIWTIGAVKIIGTTRVNELGKRKQDNEDKKVESEATRPTRLCYSKLIYSYGRQPSAGQLARAHNTTILHYMSPVVALSTCRIDHRLSRGQRNVYIISCVWTKSECNDLHYYYRVPVNTSRHRRLIFLTHGTGVSILWTYKPNKWRELADCI